MTKANKKDGSVAIMGRCEVEKTVIAITIDTPKEDVEQASMAMLAMLRIAPAAVTFPIQTPQEPE